VICSTECDGLCSVSSNNPTMMESTLSLQHISPSAPESGLAWAQVFLARLGIRCPRLVRNGKIIPCHLVVAVSEKKSSPPSRPWVSSSHHSRDNSSACSWSLNSQGRPHSFSQINSDLSSTQTLLLLAQSFFTKEKGKASSP